MKNLSVFEAIKSRVKSCVYTMIVWSFRFIRPHKNRVCIVDGTPNSGSNSRAMYDYIVNTVNHKDVVLVDKLLWRGMSLRDFFEVASSYIYITTHGSVNIPSNRILIQAWHGIPLKCMNYMDRYIDKGEAERWHRDFNYSDWVLSSSNLYEVLMSSCVGIPKSKFIRTGFPRNDYLFESDEVVKQSVLKLFGDARVTGSTRIITYLPTFRIGYKHSRIEGKLRDGNIFGFESSDYSDFNYSLEKSDYVIIAKLHPFEEELVKGFDQCSRVKIVDSDWLKKNGFDIYHLLAISDMLITDYSSVYFDFLLLDRPIIFVTNDLAEYRENRGLLLEPYEEWTPGFKVETMEQLIGAIEEYSRNSELHEEHREHIRKMAYDEDARNDNCERVWKLLIQPFLEDG